MSITESSATIYNGEVTLIFREKKETNYRRYFVLDSKEVDEKNKIKKKTLIGGSTLAKVGDQSGLISWAAKVGALHIHDLVISGEVITEEDIVEAGRKHQSIKEDAGGIGERVHAWCEYYIKHKISEKGYELPPTLPEEDIQPAISAFLDFVISRNVVFVASEGLVYSRKYGWGGKFDFIAYIDGLLTLGDIKTSNSISNETLIQTVIYQQAKEEETEYSGNPMKFDQRLIIRLTKETEDQYMERKKRYGMFDRTYATIPQYKPLELFFIGRDLYERDLKAAEAAKIIYDWNNETNFYKQSKK